MKFKSLLSIVIMSGLALSSCRNEADSNAINIVFLHHSTGNLIWRGTSELSLFSRAARKLNHRLGDVVGKQPELLSMFNDYNESSGKNYLIEEMSFPKSEPYGWKNYPYDYYNIWVKNSGNVPYMKEPTLEILIQQYQVVIFKHCFPVSNIQPDLASADINSDQKTIANYKLQYLALRDKLHEFTNTKFILSTGAAQVKSNISEDEAKRASEFFEWVIKEWDLPGDNIYLWNLYTLQTAGGLYFRDEYAESPDNSHPNSEFAGKAAKLLFSRIIDVIESEGSKTLLTGEKK